MFPRTRRARTFIGPPGVPDEAINYLVNKLVICAVNVMNVDNNIVSNASNDGVSSRQADAS